MRLMVLVFLCCAVGFAMGAWYQDTQTVVDEQADVSASISGQVGMGSDMSLFLSTSGVLCEAVGDVSRQGDMERIGNQARERKAIRSNRLVDELFSEQSTIDSINGTILDLNDQLRSRVTEMVLLKGEGHSISRVEAIDFVVGNLGLIRDAEVGLRSQLSDEQEERLGDEAMNPFAYLDDDVVQLFRTLSSTSYVP